MELRDKILGGAPLAIARVVYQRAHDRGEIDLDSVPPAVLSMPFDLVRHDLLMDLRPLEPERIHSIINDLFIPLAQRRSEQPGPTSPPTPNA